MADERTALEKRLRQHTRAVFAIRPFTAAWLLFWTGLAGLAFIDRRFGLGLWITGEALGVSILMLGVSLARGIFFALLKLAIIQFVRHRAAQQFRVGPDLKT